MNAQQMVSTFVISAALDPTLQNTVELHINQTQLTDTQKSALIALFRANVSQVKAGLSTAVRSTRATLTKLATQNFSIDPLFSGSVDDLTANERLALFTELATIVSVSAATGGAAIAQLPTEPDVTEALEQFQQAANDGQ